MRLDSRASDDPSGAGGKAPRALRWVIGFLASVCVLLPARAAQSDDLSELSLEELMEIEVTSVSRSEEPWFEAPAAVYVITAEDIRRSGATQIPDLLRMVPGLEVAQSTSSGWAVSARGFNGLFANKLLVLIDGRSVYTPLFSGVYWDVQDTLLEDIERIEVIRGPGGALWGANAVNGVINIITKSAADTQGGVITGGGGNEEHGFGGARWGGAAGSKLHYRGYVKYFNRDELGKVDGQDPNDQWDVLRGGFRADWEPTEVDSVQFQGDIYQGDIGSRVNVAIPEQPFSDTRNQSTDVAGGNVLGRWHHHFSEANATTIQVYYDRTVRDPSVLSEDRDTFDLDFQHQLGLGSRQRVTWGFGYRLSIDDTRDSFGLRIQPSSRNDQLFSAFVQDQIALTDEIALTVGTKLEHNDYTGWEVQPSGRLSWMPLPEHFFWTAISRAVRTPSRSERDSFLTVFFAEPEPGAFVTGGGDDGFDSETVLAYEVGYRTRPLRNLTFDLALFYNDYDDLAVIEPGEPFVSPDFDPPQIVFPTFVNNSGSGRSYGLELATEWRPVDRWRLAASYTWLDLDIDPNSDTGFSFSRGDENPCHQFNVRSYLDLPWNLELDGAVYWVDELKAFDVSDYVRVDLRLGWQATDSLELSVVGQNLSDPHHRELGANIVGIQPGAVERSVYGRATWRF